MRDINSVIDYARMAQDAYNEFNFPDAAKSDYDSTGKTNVKSENTTIKRIFVNKYSGNINVSAYKKDVFDKNNVCLSSELVVSFGGTNGGKDFLSDTSLGFPFFNDIGNKIKYDIEDIIPICFNQKNAEDIKITSVGHSLGGCYAELFAASFYGSEKYRSDKKVDVFTFNGLGCVSGMNQYLKDGVAANKTQDNLVPGLNGEEKPKIAYNGAHSGGNNREHLLPLVYDRNKVGVAEHFSNESDPVSGISNHIAGEEYVTMTDNFFLNVFGNHSISGLIKDLEKTDITPVLRGFNGIEPLDYLNYFNGASRAEDIMRGFEDNLGGSRSDNKYVGNDKNSFFEGYVGNDTLIGGGGNDFLSGGVGRDVLADSEEDISKMKSLSLRTDSSNKYVGGKDDDTIIDTAGNDTIFYNKGDGHDLMVLSETLRDSDKVIFGEDIKPGDLSFTVSGDKMVMHIAKGKDKEGSLTFDNWFTSKNTSAKKVELFVFKDGTELTWQQISEMATMKVKFGTDNADTINGDRGVKNVIYGLGGNDTLIGMGENDVIYGGDGDDVIDGGYEDDIIIGGRGNDKIKSLYGYDVIRYSLGDGDDLISTNGNWDVENKSKIVFSDGINAEDVSFKAESKNLLILISKNGHKAGSVTIENWFINDNNDTSRFKLKGVEFASGDFVSLVEINKKVKSGNNIGDNLNNEITGFHWERNIIHGGGGNDILKGGNFNDEIYGDDGDDEIYGGSGDILIGGKGDDNLYDCGPNTVFVYNKGDGDDVIHPRFDVNENTIVFGRGISASDISFNYKGRDMIIGVKGSGSITIKNREYIPGLDTPNVGSLIEYYRFEGDEKRTVYYEFQKYIAEVAYNKKSTEMSSRASHQYDLLSQEMAASDADAEPTVDYNKQNQDLYAYIEH